MLIKCFRLKRGNDEGRMAFNKRVANKLNRWFALLQYKPIITYVLERVYCQLWHEKAVAKTLSAIRIDRDVEKWQLMKSLETSARKRRLDGGFVDARTGPPPCTFEHVFCRIWGHQWALRE